MSAAKCQRAWEAEAAHDGRLELAALEAHEQHLAHCEYCAQKRRRLARFSVLLRTTPAPDELTLRRVRQQVLSAMHDRTLHAGTARGRRMYGMLAGAMLVAALGIGTWLHASGTTPARAAATLQLTPEPGARYVHDQRHGSEYVELHDGALAIAFVRGRGPGLVVRVPDGEIQDLGTVFRILVAQGRTKEISVQSGAVVFHRTGEPDVVVEAGQVFLLPPEEAPSNEADAALAPTTSDSLINYTAPQSIAKHARHKRLAQPHADPSQSAEQQDIAYLRILALLQEGRRAEARVAAQEFLARYPGGFRRTEVASIAAPTTP